MYFVTKDFCQHYLSSHGQKKLLIIRIEKARRSKLTFLIRNWFIKIGRLGRFLQEEERNVTAYYDCRELKKKKVISKVR